MLETRTYPIGSVVKWTSCWVLVTRASMGGAIGQFKYTQLHVIRSPHKALLADGATGSVMKRLRNHLQPIHAASLIMGGNISRHVGTHRYCKAPSRFSPSPIHRQLLSWRGSVRDRFCLPDMRPHLVLPHLLPRKRGSAGTSTFIARDSSVKNNRIFLCLGTPTMYA